MTLQLDARQRAMLEEMGVRLFVPAQPLVEAVAVAVRSMPVPVATPAPAIQQRSPVAPMTAPVPAAPAPVRTPSADQPGVEMLEWDALAQAVVACRACQLCEGRREPVMGAGD
ncbi:MAG: uracil-DNA glycosylase, partial [Comamonadaceae bacterium]